MAQEECALLAEENKKLQAQIQVLNTKLLETQEKADGFNQFADDIAA